MSGQRPAQSKSLLGLYCPSCCAEVSALVCRAIAAAEKAAPAMAAMGSYQRKEVLEHCVREFERRFEDLAISLCVEAGKPIKVGALLDATLLPLCTAPG